MKKYILLFILAVISLATNAQTTEPNRLIIVDKIGNDQTYNIKDIDSIGFATVEGTVAADVKVLGYAQGKGTASDTIWVAVTKTPACYTYKILVLPTNTANQITSDLMAEAYMNRYDAIRQWDDFTNAQMTGFDKKFKPGTSYTVVTVGHDGYDTPCEYRKAEFTTPEAQLVGNPQVTCEVTKVTPTTITYKFTPNADVKEYTYRQFDHKGGAMDDFEYWGPMFGYDNLGDYIFINNFTYDGEEEYTYEGLMPGQEYELAILALDANGNYAPITYTYATTEQKGGTGEAKVDITIGDFKQDVASGSYIQRVIFTPNDQTLKYHAALFTAKNDGTEWTEEEILTYLKSDNNPNFPPFFQDPNWDIIDVDDNYWTLDTNLTFTAAAIAQNANGEWGPLTKVTATTPDAPNAAKTMKAGKKMPQRMFTKQANPIPSMSSMKQMIPAKKTGIQIIEK